MIDAGLLHEVYDIYRVNADYTRGLRQAIGVREFEDFLKVYQSTSRNCKMTESADASCNPISTDNDHETLKEHMGEILNSSSDSQLKLLLQDAIDKVKLNTRRLVRRQKRRVSRLQTLFGWHIHYVDVTESISGKSEESWALQVVGPALEIIKAFLSEDKSSISDIMDPKNTGQKLNERDLWAQYICKACGDKILRGAYEWEQHKQGRRHRKRISQLRKSQGSAFLDQQQQQKS